MHVEKNGYVKHKILMLIYLHLSNIIIIKGSPHMKKLLIKLEPILYQINSLLQNFYSILSNQKFTHRKRIRNKNNYKTTCILAAFKNTDMESFINYF